MAYRIAVTGKGGTGKTTVAALTVMRLIATGRTPVLAVDADPNTCLDEALGVSVTATVGGVREEARTLAQQGLAAGASKQQLLEMKIAESLVECRDFDLVAMGRSEGPGCYCYANNVLKQTMAQLADSYPWMVLDNEAGLENLSRRLAPEIDLLVMVSDPSRRGLNTVRRLHALATEMGISFAELVLVVNRCRGGTLSDYAVETGAEIGAARVVAIAEDDDLARLAEEGRSYGELPSDSSVHERIDELLASAPAATPARAQEHRGGKDLWQTTRRRMPNA